MSTVNVALIGYGFVGKVFHAPLITHTPGMSLHTVVSRDAAKVHADHPHVRVIADAAQAFADPVIDLIVIASPNDTHAPLALEALALGKHVVVDKPFTVTLAEAESVIARAREVSRLVSVFQNRRWDADFLALRQLLADDELGELAELHSHFDRFRPNVQNRWREDAAPGGGLWYDLGPHLIDQALQLLGTPIAVQADLAQQRDDARATDYFHVQLRYPRCRVHLHAGSLVAGNGLRFAAHGTHGSFLKHGLDTQEDQLRAGVAPGVAGWGIDARPGELITPQTDGPHARRSIDGFAGDYRHFYAAMHAAITCGAPLPVSPEQALSVMRIIELGTRSTQERRELPFA